MQKSLNNTEQFLETYKAFERAACSTGHLSKLSWISGTDTVDTIFTLEQFISDQEIKDKIKVCRTLRNYIQHHPDADSFLSVTAGETAFLKERTEEILALNGTAKDIMVRCSTILTDKNTLADFAAAMSAKNLSAYPYQEKNGEFSVLTAKNIVKTLGSGKTARQKISSAVTEKEKIRVGFAFQNTPVPLLPGTDIIVILTQTKDKAIGIIGK